jgi:hypothetical protein
MNGILVKNIYIKKNGAILEELILENLMCMHTVTKKDLNWIKS